MGAGVQWWEGILGRGSSRSKVAWRVVWGYCQPRVGRPACRDHHEECLRPDWGGLSSRVPWSPECGAGMECWLLLDSDCCQQLRLGLLLMGEFNNLCLTFPSSQGCSA